MGREECGEANETNVLYIRNGEGFGVARAWYRETEGSATQVLTCESLLSGDTAVPLGPDDVSFGDPIGTALVASASEVGFFFVTCPQTSLGNGDTLTDVEGCLGGYSLPEGRFVPDTGVRGEISLEGEFVDGYLVSSGVRETLDSDGNYLGSENAEETLYFRGRLCE